MRDRYILLSLVLLISASGCAANTSSKTTGCAHDYFKSTNNPKLDEEIENETYRTIYPHFFIEDFCKPEDRSLEEWYNHSDVVFEGYLFDLAKSVPRKTSVTNQCISSFHVRRIYKGEEELRHAGYTKQAMVWGEHKSNSDKDDYDMNLCRYRVGQRYIVFTKVDPNKEKINPNYLYQNIECNGSRPYDSKMIRSLEEMKGKAQD